MSLRITTDGRREFYYYGPSSDGIPGAVTRVMSSFPGYSWDADSKHEPEWDQYLGPGDKIELSLISAIGAI